MITPNLDLSSGRLVAEFVGPLLHFVQTRPVGVYKGDRTGGASRGAGRVATAQVALLDFASLLHVVDGAKRASDGAHLAADAGGFVHHHGAGDFVFGDRLDRASMQAPRFVTLRAGVGHFFTRLVEVKYFDARFGCGKCAVILERTGHLALKTARAFVRVNVQDFLHLHLQWQRNENRVSPGL